MSHKRHIPEGYAEFAKGKGRRELCLHYQTSPTTISRWNVEAGIGRPPRPERPVPADFAAFAPGKPAEHLARHYGVCSYTICKWRRQLGIEGCGRGNIHRKHWRYLPDDFALYAHEGSKKLCKRYGTCTSVIQRWRQESGLRAKPGGEMRPMPEDFTTLALKMCARHLQKHYGAGAKTIIRWIKEAGVTPPRYVMPPRPRKPKPLPKPRRVVIPFKGHKQTPLPPRDYSLHGEAANYLRRWAATYRCTERGAADHKGDYWRHGNVILTPDEMLQRAQSKGFTLAAWAA